MIGRYRDFGLAEDSLQDAWLLAAERWPVDGWPRDPAAWVYTAASRRAIDHLRRESSRQARHERADADDRGRELDELERREERWHSGIDDDRLRLIFTCCHPALGLEGRIALTLRSVAWLTTDEIAAAFGVPTATMAQRIVRAKNKIKSAGIPYRVPLGHELPDRLDGVLGVVYLVFNEAYLSARAAEPLRVDLAEEAIRLGRQLVELMPDEPEVLGLLALMLVHHARSAARFDRAGDLVLLEHQDRSQWDAELIAEGSTLVERALRRRTIGSYQLQAAIAALHSQAPSFEATDWAQIEQLYGVLARVDPSPVVALNRAVAIGFADGAEAGLTALDAVDDDLPQAHLLASARAEFLLRAGRRDEASAQFRLALELVGSDAERRHLERRLASV
ncbi:RNA polymerase sigma factor [Ilumatobacter sp.]|uniref:RNA polymerase sigma factor n=1 Tax=Ilumatobacter sp. TaxID=1967498 RepID=UPI00345CE001